MCVGAFSCFMVLLFVENNSGKNLRKGLADLGDLGELVRSAMTGVNKWTLLARS